MNKDCKSNISLTQLWSGWVYHPNQHHHNWKSLCKNFTPQKLWYWVLRINAYQNRVVIRIILINLYFRFHKLVRKRPILSDWSFSAFGYLEGGFERRLLATCRWHVATAVAFPQKSESVLTKNRRSSKRDRRFLKVTANCESWISILSRKKPSWQIQFLCYNISCSVWAAGIAQLVEQLICNQ